MLWLAAYLTGFPPAGLYTLCWTHGLAPGIFQFDTFRHYSNFCSHFVNGTWPPGARTLDTGLSIALNTTVVILFFHSLDKLRCSTRGLACNAFYLNNFLVGSRGATSRCSFVYLCFILHSSVLFHASIWLRPPHTPVGNPIWTHIYVTIRLFIIAPP